MKKLLYILPIVALLFMAVIDLDAKGKSNGSGVSFYEGDWSEVVEKAGKEHKLIFLDIYATWCSPCKLLKSRTFPDKDLGTYFNKHFVNVTLDGEKGKGLELANKYMVKGYPTLLILDEKGRVISERAGYKTPEMLLEMGKDAVAKYEKEYKK